MLIYLWISRITLWIVIMKVIQAVNNICVKNTKRHRKVIYSTFRCLVIILEIRAFLVIFPIPTLFVLILFGIGFLIANLLAFRGSLNTSGCVNCSSICDICASNSSICLSQCSICLSNLRCCLFVAFD